MPSIQETVHRFFNDNISRGSDIDTPSAIYQFLGERGFLQAHVSERWKAFAESVGYFYVGDIDIQNKVATGVIPITNYDPDAKNYFDVFSTPLNSTRKDLVNDFVLGLKDDSLWSLLDWVSIAQPTGQGFRINLKNPSQIATEGNSPTYTSDLGYAGNGTTSYIDTGVPNSTVVGTNCSLFGFVDLSGPTRTGCMGSQGNRHSLNEGASSAVLGYLVAATAVSGGTSSNDNFIAVSRNETTTEVQSGTSTGTPTTVTNLALAARNIRFLSNNDNYWAGRLSVAGFGKALNSTQRANLRLRIRTYLQAIGAI